MLPPVHAAGRLAGLRRKKSKNAPRRGRLALGRQVEFIIIDLGSFPVVGGVGGVRAPRFGRSLAPGGERLLYVVSGGVGPPAGGAASQCGKEERRLRSQ